MHGQWKQEKTEMTDLAGSKLISDVAKGGPSRAHPYIGYVLQMNVKISIYSNRTV